MKHEAIVTQAECFAVTMSMSSMSMTGTGLVKNVTSQGNQYQRCPLQVRAQKRTASGEDRLYASFNLCIKPPCVKDGLVPSCRCQEACTDACKDTLRHFCLDMNVSVHAVETKDHLEPKDVK